MNPQAKKVLTQVIIIVFFAVFSFAYFFPTIEGKVLNQMDNKNAKAISEEARTYEKSENRDIAWTNSLFSGMPTYQVGGISRKNIFSPILRLINHTVLPYGTVSVLFVYLLGFYILLLSFKIDKWLSLVGAVAFALSSYNIIIIAAGHITKTYAIGLMPIIIAGFILLYDKKYWLGAITALLGLGLQITTTHIQIIYYTGLTVGLLVAFQFFWSLKEKKLKQFYKATIFAFAIAFIAVLPNITTMWQAYEMSKYSIRGQNELSSDNNKQNGGLDKDYALSWSYGVDESFSLLVPNVKGGASGAFLYDELVAMYQGTAEEKEDAEKKLDKYSQEFVNYIVSGIQNNFPISSYWGSQPFTSGPVYLGAFILFLFIFGMFVVKNKIKWWLFVATALALILSWGRNFELVTDIFFNYFPFYNKFRTVSMTLVIVSVTIPLLSFLTLKEIIAEKGFIQKNIKSLWYALGITGFLLIIPMFFNYLSAQEIEYFDNYVKQIPQGASQVNDFLSELETARKSVYTADAFRSLIFILLGVGLLFAFSKFKKFKQSTFIIVLGLLIVADMWTIDRRYLSDDNFQKKSDVNSEITASLADEFILKDTDPYYRVLNIGNPFNDAFTSRFHKSIGGYHGAKLRRYQDVIDNYLGFYNQAIINTLQDTTGDINLLFQQMQVLNMLNTKYIIYNPNQYPIVNMHTFGNAWFVDNFKFVKTPDEEIKALETENLKRTAIINENNFDKSELPELSYSSDSTKYIKLTNYKPDILEFEVKTNKTDFVVFSDIYYPKGWNAYIDGEPTTIYQTNYILRGLIIPAGNHTIKFEFKPAAIFTAQKIAFVSSIIVLLILLGGIYMIYKNSIKKREESQKTDKK